jgi:hypothetical protein
MWLEPCPPLGSLGWLQPLPTVANRWCQPPNPSPPMRSNQVNCFQGALFLYAREVFHSWGSIGGAFQRGFRLTRVSVFTPDSRPESQLSPFARGLGLGSVPSRRPVPRPTCASSSRRGRFRFSTAPGRWPGRSVPAGSAARTAGMAAGPHGWRPALSTAADRPWSVRWSCPASPAPVLASLKCDGCGKSGRGD